MKAARHTLLSWMIAIIGLASGALPASADVITLDVSANMFVFGGVGSCSAAGCTLGGDIVIDNSAGTLISGDVTMAGESPIMGPFTEFIGMNMDAFGHVYLVFDDASSDGLALFLASSSLVGYTGGDLTTATEVAGQEAVWFLSSGSLTSSSIPVPEPNSITLLGAAVAIVSLIQIGRRRV